MSAVFLRMLLPLVILMCAAATNSSCKACRGCRHDKPAPAVEAGGHVPQDKTAERLSPRMREFIARFDSVLDEQRREQRLDEEEVRLSAARRLTERAAAETIGDMLSLDPVADAARIADLAQDLADMGEPARAALAALLDADMPPDHRRMIIMALGRFRDDKAAAILHAEALRARDAKVRDAALAALRGTRPAGDLVSRSAAGLGRAGPEGGSAPSRADSMAHIAVLGALGGREAVDRLIDVVRTSDDAQVKAAALAALGDAGGDDAAAFLKDVMRNDAGLRDAAAKALGAMKREDVVIGMGEILMDAASDSAMRVAAVKGLGQDNGKMARMILFNVLRDTRQPRDVHQQATAALTAGFTEGSDAETMNYIALFERTPVDYLPQMLQQLIARGGDFAAIQLDARFERLNRPKKIHAVRTLARVGGTRTFDMLARRLDAEREPSLRREIIAAMKTTRGDVDRPSLTAKIASLAADAADSQERIAAMGFLADIAPSEAVRIAEGNMASTDDRAVMRASIDIIRRHGGAGSENALYDLKRRDEKGEYRDAIDGAVKAIEARNK